ncbi:MAG TPA: hypothetical protein VKB95_08100 [Chitinophagaceae bacterium]|nr:hypothetical protein [Chitinophagaceae bacterium]
MSLRSKNKTATKAWYIIKAIVRVVVRTVIEAVHRFVINIFDTLCGFLKWPGKKLRIKIFILKDRQAEAPVSSTDLEAATEFVRRSFKKNFNVKLLPHYDKGSFAGVLQKNAPPEVLHTKGGIGALGEEFKIAGSFFAANLSGVFYPVTAFVVIDIEGATGCSLGPITDYVTLDPFGAKNVSILAHELAHACGLWHVKDRSNLLWPSNDRGDEVKWWQKNIFRGSRHVTYW